MSNTMRAFENSPCLPGSNTTGDMPLEIMRRFRRGPSTLYDKEAYRLQRRARGPSLNSGHASTSCIVRPVPNVVITLEYL